MSNEQTVPRTDLRYDLRVQNIFAIIEAELHQ